MYSLPNVIKNIKGYEELTEKEKYYFCNKIDNKLPKYINYFLKFINDKVTKDMENKEDFNFIIMEYILLTDKLTFNFLYEKIVLNFENSFIKKRFLDSLDDYPEKYIKDLKLFK